MNRITERFAKLRSEARKGVVVYIGAGDPNLQATQDLALCCDRCGVDVLELGVPFSDPLADGIVNQLAAQRGLNSGTTPSKLLATIAQIRRTSQIPIVLYVYYNLVHRQGQAAFIQAAAAAGVDGLLILDLPPEEGESYKLQMAQAGLCPIFLIAPTTPEERVQTIVRGASGFIYYVSREGVTGMQQQISNSIAEKTAVIRKHTDLPIAVGFGISNPEQAAQVAASADAVVVGSAVVDQIADAGNTPALIPNLTNFLAPLVAAVKAVKAV